MNKLSINYTKVLEKSTDKWYEVNMIGLTNDERNKLIKRKDEWKRLEEENKIRIEMIKLKRRLKWKSQTWFH